MTQQQELMAAFGKQEELHPDLAEHLYEDGMLGPCIKHPLLFCILYSPTMNALLNLQYREKVRALGEAQENAEWSNIVFIHERAYRVDAFLDIMDDMPDDDYWQLLARIWIDSENIRENQDIWHELLTEERPHRELLMDEDERLALAAMPDQFLVFQGHTHVAHDGWSWTTNEDTAKWFARRFASFEHAEPMVTEGIVNKADVIAYFTGRNESEIIVPRELVTFTITWRVS
jgi:hypothetical protein